MVDHSYVVEVPPTSNYTFIFDLTPGFNRLNNYKARRETFKFLGFVAWYIRDLALFHNFLIYYVCHNQQWDIGHMFLARTMINIIFVLPLCVISEKV